MPKEKIIQNKVVKISEEAKRALHNTKRYSDKNWSDTILNLAEVFLYVKHNLTIEFVAEKMRYNLGNYVSIDDSEAFDDIYNVNISLHEFVDLFGSQFYANNIKEIKQSIDSELREYLADHIILPEDMELHEKEYLEDLALQEKEIIYKNSLLRAKRQKIGRQYSLYSEIKLSYIITKKGDQSLIT